MTTRLLAVAAILAGSLGLTACQSTNQTVGAGAGGVIGGLVGSQFGSGTGRLIATGIGVGVGALIGQQVGAYLDERDRQMAEQSTIQTYRTGATQTWSNPDTGASGRVEPVGGKTVAASGGDCQLQEQTITLDDGTTETTRYRLCERNGEFYTEPA
jgi:surface antigen